MNSCLFLSRYLEDTHQKEKTNLDYFAALATTEKFYFSIV